MNDVEDQVVAANEDEIEEQEAREYEDDALLRGKAAFLVIMSTAMEELGLDADELIAACEAVEGKHVPENLQSFAAGVRWVLSLTMSLYADEQQNYDEAVVKAIEEILAAEQPTAIH